MAKSFRVAEIFGPTIQGEGRSAGIPSHFIRFGGCDLRCKWCDTPYAVLPELIAQLPRMTVMEIIDALFNLPPGPRWVVITGGNPALLDLGGLIDALTQCGFKSMIETQGTIWKNWLSDVDELCISPKPPSSGNTVTLDTLQTFLEAGILPQSRYLKTVVFDKEDYEYARLIHNHVRDLEMFISVGNDDPELPTVGDPHPDPEGHGGPSRGESRDRIGHNYRKIAEWVMKDPHMRDVKVLPQLHVLAWGNERGR